MALTKKAALAALLDKLRRDYEEVVAAQKATAEGATHEESRPENDKDTRALEATYLARGLAERVDDLREAVTRLKNLSDAPITGDGPVSVPALVTLEDEDGGVVRYLLAPVGGGTELTIDGDIVKVITPSAPVGQALKGQHVGDDVVVRTPKGKRELVVEALE
jgi:transcription elongation GreA/GreB family factor